MSQLPTDTSSENTSRAKNAVRLWLRLLSCERAIEKRLRAHLRVTFNITLPQFEVLCELDRQHEPMAMARLSEELMVTSSNVTGVIDRLERVGLVQRFGSPTDRRVQNIDMTAEGRKLFVKIASNNREWCMRIFQGLSDGEVSQLQNLLLKTRLLAVQARA